LPSGARGGRGDRDESGLRLANVRGSHHSNFGRPARLRRGLHGMLLARVLVFALMVVAGIGGLYPLM
jgi:hypothetical protein